MKVLFIVAHPKHIFIFRNTIEYFENKGIPYRILAVEKDIVIELLNTFQLKYEIIGKNKKGIINKLIEIPARLIKGLTKTREFTPSIIVGQADPIFAIIGKLLSIPTIFLPDSEGAFLSRYIAFPLATDILLPNSYTRSVKYNNIRLNHYLELAYLHPNCFQSSDDVYSLLKLSYTEKYVLMRFVSWNAHHDIGHKGMTIQNKIDAVEKFSKYAKVFISSENKLPPELEKYRINIKPEKIHDVMKNASLFFGESATMATESAVLGTPAIYIDNVGTGYTKDIEKKYGLIFTFTESLQDQKKAIQKGIEILNAPQDSKNWNKKREILLKDKIDFSSFLNWFIENYPKSSIIMKENSDYQNNFK